MAGTVEVVVCKVDELGEGDPREVKVGDTTALVVREKGQLYAVGNKCSHYGAPLSKGAYCGGVLRCPWHGACFNVKTGDIEDFPGMDSLPVFQVEERGEDVVVKADPVTLKSAKRVKAMTRNDPSNKKTFVLIGGGAASASCAETLRQEGFTGRVVVLTKEHTLPYDRPKLSKAMSTTVDAIALRNKEFYDSVDIELSTGTEVTGVNTEHNTVTDSTGKTHSYDALFIATGGTPRTVPIPGCRDLKNVFVLRTPQDANLIAAGAKGKKVVIIGSSFIGMEVAACLAEGAGSVVVVGQGTVPFQAVLGSKVGQMLQKLHEERGVKFYMERGLTQLHGKDGVLTQALLSDGTALDADVCVLAIGVVPATDFLKDSGVELTQRGFVTVDQCMRTSADGVFAAGDIAQFPLFVNDGQPANVQHWQMALQQGRIAALNMLGKSVAIHSVPYFWTVMYGKSVRYTGYGAGYDDIVIHGDLSVPQFAAFYTKKDKVLAVASLAFDPIVSQAACLMEQGGTILKSEIMDDPKSWVSRLKE
ncbi:apoptosis-inducing factor 3-like isoform X2 [Babylonia areolata]